jgi:O-antigen/teichoic acid export membrane protein
MMPRACPLPEGPRLAVPADVRAPLARAHPRDGAGVARNALFLLAGQIATAALSFGITAVLARHLGAEDYGVLFLAASLVQSALVLADLGQEYYVVRAVAKDRGAAATLLGTGLVLRVLAALAAYSLLMVLVSVLGYPAATVTAISLTAVFFVVTAIGDGISLVLRGLERMDLEAALRVASKTLVAVAVGIAVIGGGRLTAVLVMQILAAAAAVILYGFTLRRVDVPRPRVRLSTAVAMIAGGAPFLFWALAVNAQPGIDALLLSVLAAPNTIGWHAAAWKLIGILTLPVNVLAAALYPTLSRLHGERSARFGELVTAGLKPTILAGFLGAAGTYLFADTAVALIYGSEGFGPAAANLKLLAAYVLLVFVNIALGSAIIAAGLQNRWIGAKLASLAIAAALAVVLVPRFQAAVGNGGLGCAAATVAAEATMLAAALSIIPLRTRPFRVELAKNLGRGAAAAAVMATAAWALADLGPFTRVAGATAAYVAAVVLVGGIRREDLRVVRDVVGARSRP